MKKHIFIAAATFIIMTACKDPQKDEAVVRQRDSLMAVIEERETSVNDFISTFNEVESNLDSIRVRQHIISVSSDKGDAKVNRKEHLNAQIKAINELMEANNKKIRQLNSKINRADKRNAQLEKTIRMLNGQLNQKYLELAELNDKLASMNAAVTQLQIAVDTLSYQNMAQQQTISERNTELHTAYYIVGTSKELTKSNLIDKKGGLLGIGRTSKLSDNLDNSMFTKIDYLETTTIPIGSKNAKVITTHPSDSYIIDKTDKMVNSIVINDPVKFWSASKYLVVTK